MEPSDRAIEERDGGRSGDEGAERSCAEGAAMDSGRRMLPLPDLGRCFHERVPERPRAAALVAGFLGSVSSAAGVGAVVVVLLLDRRCRASARALSAGCRGGLAGLIGLMAGDCGVEGLSGEMERARSVGHHGQSGQSEPGEGVCGEGEERREGEKKRLGSRNTVTVTVTVTGTGIEWVEGTEHTRTHLLAALVSRCGPESAPPRAS